jgi:hypothetical protein
MSQHIGRLRTGNLCGCILDVQPNKKLRYTTANSFPRPMRHFFSSCCRLIACFLVMSVLTSEIAMAAYICPPMTQSPAHEMNMRSDAPCIGMDEVKPVHCAEHHAGAQIALEHLAASPSVAPVSIAFVIPVPAPIVPAVLVPSWPDVPLEQGTSPPYLQTQRLRI